MKVDEIYSLRREMLVNKMWIFFMLYVHSLWKEYKK